MGAFAACRSDICMSATNTAPSRFSGGIFGEAQSRCARRCGFALAVLAAVGGLPSPRVPLGTMTPTLQLLRVRFTLSCIK